MKYFGTDGIRGTMDEKINASLMKKVAHGIIRYYNKNNLPRMLLVGNDTRASHSHIMATIGSILVRYGIEVHNIGPCSSPALAYLTKNYKYPLSMMITASHNSYTYNGIKFFNEFGEKIDDDVELELESHMDAKSKLGNIQYVEIKDKRKLLDSYINYLKSIDVCKLPCIFDCACGGTSNIVRKLYPKYKKINANPNGVNINVNSGSTHIESLQAICRKKHMIGFAFDGDGDRVIAVSETGDIIDGDKLLCILSNFYQKAGDTLVGTLTTNKGLQDYLQARKIQFIRAKVGDKNVYNAMKKYSSILGGETAGHIIIKNYSNTGDGVLTAIILRNILSLSKVNFKDLLSLYHDYFQAQKNIPFETNKKFVFNQRLNELIAQFESAGARVLIRPSGTEPVLRVMVEHLQPDIANDILNQLIECINAI